MAFSAVIAFPSHCCSPKSAVPIVRRGRKLRCCSSSFPTHFDLRTYWTTLIKEIDQKLNDAVPVMYPERLHEAMRYSLLTKGAKRVPPLLCIATCELLGGSRLAAFPTACALEMAHLTTLIHDDLPCVDDSPSRRGQPCSHTVFSVDMALLAGGALTLVGYRNIVTQTPADVVPETRTLQVTAEISRSIGAMAGARFLDLSATPNAGDSVREKKLGEIFGCSAACGGLLAGASDDEIGRLRKYGRAAGVLYQLVDDILEVAGRERENVNGEHEKKREKGYVSVYGVEKGLEVAEELRSQAKKELDGWDRYGDKVLVLYDFVDYAAHRGFNF